jgi:ElaB/YqjD/DUF883 family membrane-anchored ribosome-binding protein
VPETEQAKDARIVLTPEQIREIVGVIAKDHRVILGPDDPVFFFATVCAAVCEAALADATLTLNEAADNLKHGQDKAMIAVAGTIQNETKSAISAIQGFQSENIQLVKVELERALSSVRQQGAAAVDAVSKARAQAAGQMLGQSWPVVAIVAALGLVLGVLAGHVFL